MRIKRPGDGSRLAATGACSIIMCSFSTVSSSVYTYVYVQVVRVHLLNTSPHSLHSRWSGQRLTVSPQSLSFESSDVSFVRTETSLTVAFLIERVRFGDTLVKSASPGTLRQQNMSKTHCICPAATWLYASPSACF
jgi:hypothetical protein